MAMGVMPVAIFVYFWELFLALSALHGISFLWCILRIFSAYGFRMEA